MIIITTLRKSDMRSSGILRSI